MRRDKLLSKLGKAADGALDQLWKKGDKEGKFCEIILGFRFFAVIFNYFLIYLEKNSFI